MEKTVQASRPVTIVHVDMDAFYAAVEQLDHPEYRGRPVVVGADPAGGSGRGVVSAASYEARRFGIHSALPISAAWKQCPHAVYLSPRIHRYEEISRRVMEILDGFSPRVEQLSIDEAFLDCTGTGRLLGSPEELGRKIKESICADTGLTASVGIAPCKSVAKIASDLCKPDGLMICPPGGEREFLAPLPVKLLWGAGAKTTQRLAQLGCETVGDVARTSREVLERVLGSWGGRLWELANGIDPRPVVSLGGRKSISEEITFDRDTGDLARIEQVLFAVADRVTGRMRKERIAGRTVALKIRLQGFETHTRSRTLDRAVNDTQTVRDTGVELFRGFDRGGRKVRLIGLGLSNLRPCEGGGQLNLFATPEVSDPTDELLDLMRDRYGDKVTRASFLPPRSRSRE
jgi:nucleotidyltransferase/DNA polymerase involved in DNA repair